MASKYSMVDLIFFISLTSLPLYLFMLYYEQLLEQILLESIDLLPLPPNDYFDYNGVQTNPANSIAPEFSTALAFLCFLRLVPLHLLELLSAISTVYLTSKIHNRETFTLKEAIRASWHHRSRFKGVLVTSIYLLSMSVFGVLGLLWFAIQCYASDKTSDLFNPLFVVVYPITMVALLVKFPEVSSIWSMSLVVSVVEEVDGVRAFSMASHFGKGSERRGVWIMVVFYAFRFGLRAPWLLEDGDRGVGFVARTGVLWGVHLVKWAACTWFYFGCKNKVLQKKADLEVGGKCEGEGLKNGS